jgi:ribosomal protein S27AE
MTTSVIFEKKLIAPCGMNCGSCIGYLRDKNKCYGCWTDFDTKRKTCVQCKIKNCDFLEKISSQFCYDCGKFPCERLNHLDKRYQAKYRTSLIQNLIMINEEGIEKFLSFETSRRTCPNCGSTVSVHRDKCMKCDYDLKTTL